MGQNGNFVRSAHAKKFCESALDRWNVPSVLGINPTPLDHFGDGEAPK
jgi:hypothetical protein